MLDFPNNVCLTQLPLLEELGVVVVLGEGV
jgi:hypothetical protein